MKHILPVLQLRAPCVSLQDEAYPTGTKFQAVPDLRGKKLPPWQCAHEEADAQSVRLAQAKVDLEQLSSSIDAWASSVAAGGGPVPDRSELSALQERHAGMEKLIEDEQATYQSLEKRLGELQGKAAALPADQTKDALASATSRIASNKDDLDGLLLLAAAAWSKLNDADKDVTARLDAELDAVQRVNDELIALTKQADAQHVRLTNMKENLEELSSSFGALRLADASRGDPTLDSSALEQLGGIQQALQQEIEDEQAAYQSLENRLGELQGKAAALPVDQTKDALASATSRLASNKDDLDSLLLLCASTCKEIDEAQKDVAARLAAEDALAVSLRGDASAVGNDATSEYDRLAKLKADMAKLASTVGSLHKVYVEEGGAADVSVVPVLRDTHVNLGEQLEEAAKSAAQLQERLDALKQKATPVPAVKLEGAVDKVAKEVDRIISDIAMLRVQSAATGQQLDELEAKLASDEASRLAAEAALAEMLVNDFASLEADAAAGLDRLAKLRADLAELAATVSPIHEQYIVQKVEDADVSAVPSLRERHASLAGLVAVEEAAAKARAQQLVELTQRAKQVTAEKLEGPGNATKDASAAEAFQSEVAGLRTESDKIGQQLDSLEAKRAAKMEAARLAADAEAARLAGEEAARLAAEDSLAKTVASRLDLTVSELDSLLNRLAKLQAEMELVSAAVGSAEEAHAQFGSVDQTELNEMRRRHGALKDLIAKETKAFQELSGRLEENKETAKKLPLDKVPQEALNEADRRLEATKTAHDTLVELSASVGDRLTALEAKLAADIEAARIAAELEAARLAADHAASLAADDALAKAVHEELLSLNKQGDELGDSLAKLLTDVKKLGYIVSPLHSTHCGRGVRMSRAASKLNRLDKNELNKLQNRHSNHLQQIEEAETKCAAFAQSLEEPVQESLKKVSARVESNQETMDAFKKASARVESNQETMIKVNTESSKTGRQLDELFRHLSAEEEAASLAAKRAADIAADKEADRLAAEAAQKQAEEVAARLAAERARLEAEEAARVAAEEAALKVLLLGLSLAHTEAEAHWDRLQLLKAEQKEVLLAARVMHENIFPSSTPTLRFRPRPSPQTGELVRLQEQNAGLLIKIEMEEAGHEEVEKQLAALKEEAEAVPKAKWKAVMKRNREKATSIKEDLVHVRGENVTAAELLAAMATKQADDAAAARKAAEDEAARLAAEMALADSLADQLRQLAAEASEQAQRVGKDQEEMAEVSPLVRNIHVAATSAQTALREGKPTGMKATDASGLPELRSRHSSLVKSVGAEEAVSADHTQRLLQLKKEASSLPPHYLKSNREAGEQLDTQCAKVGKRLDEIDAMLAAEREAARLQADEAERMAAEKEAARLAKEEAARQMAAEKAARLQAARLKAQEDARLEAEKEARRQAEERDLLNSLLADLILIRTDSDSVAERLKADQAELKKLAASVALLSNQAERPRSQAKSRPGTSQTKHAALWARVQQEEEQLLGIAHRSDEQYKDELSKTKAHVGANFQAKGLQKEGLIGVDKRLAALEGSAAAQSSLKEGLEALRQLVQACDASLGKLEGNVQVLRSLQYQVAFAQKHKQPSTASLEGAPPGVGEPRESQAQEVEEFPGEMNLVIVEPRESHAQEVEEVPGDVNFAIGEPRESHAQEVEELTHASEEEAQISSRQEVPTASHGQGPPSSQEGGQAPAASGQARSTGDGQGPAVIRQAPTTGGRDLSFGVAQDPGLAGQALAAEGEELSGQGVPVSAYAEQARSGSAEATPGGVAPAGTEPAAGQEQEGGLMEGSGQGGPPVGPAGGFGQESSSLAAEAGRDAMAKELLPVLKEDVQKHICQVRGQITQIENAFDDIGLNIYRSGNVKFQAELKTLSAQAAPFPARLKACEDKCNAVLNFTVKGYEQQRHHAAMQAWLAGLQSDVEVALKTWTPELQKQLGQLKGQHQLGKGVIRELEERLESLLNRKDSAMSIDPSQSLLPLLMRGGLPATKQPWDRRFQNDKPWFPNGTETPGLRAMTAPEGRLCEKGAAGCAQAGEYGSHDYRGPQRTFRCEESEMYDPYDEWAMSEMEWSLYMELIYLLKRMKGRHVDGTSFPSQRWERAMTRLRKSVALREPMVVPVSAPTVVFSQHHSQPRPQQHSQQHSQHRRSLSASDAPPAPRSQPLQPTGPRSRSKSGSGTVGNAVQMDHRKGLNPSRAGRNAMLPPMPLPIGAAAGAGGLNRRVEPGLASKSPSRARPAQGGSRGGPGTASVLFPPPNDLRPWSGLESFPSEPMRGAWNDPGVQGQEQPGSRGAEEPTPREGEHPQGNYSDSDCESADTDILLGCAHGQPFNPTEEFRRVKMGQQLHAKRTAMASRAQSRGGPLVPSKRNSGARASMPARAATAPTGQQPGRGVRSSVPDLGSRQHKIVAGTDPGSNSWQSRRSSGDQGQEAAGSIIYSGFKEVRSTNQRVLQSVALYSQVAAKKAPKQSALKAKKQNPYGYANSDLGNSDSHLNSQSTSKQTATPGYRLSARFV
eukprot:gene1483-32868_t